jgi:Right handed beta helix region
MIKITASLVLPALIALIVLPKPAQAQLARTFVSSEGSDAADCGRLTPCRTFQRAHDNTLAAGEITVLDPGGYGAVTISKAISIINDGVGEAGVLVSGGLNGITIAAGGSDTVSLRGLTIKGIGFGGGNGIRFNTGKSLMVENCIIRTLDGTGVGNGILFQPSASSSLVVTGAVVTDNSFLGIAVRPSAGTINLAVSNSLFVNNFAAGILVQPSGAPTIKATFSGVEAYNHFGSGITIGVGTVIASTATVNATVAESVAASNGTGFIAEALAPAAVNLLVVRSKIANNTNNGIVASGAATTVRLAQSSITGSTTGLSISSGAALLSYGDNNIDGNGAGTETPTGTIVKK